MPDCLRWGQERHQECTQYRDNGYNSCASYQRDCCTWWPCSWACEVVSWLCVAWYCVSNVVCVAWTWVTTAVCLVWDVVVLVVAAVVETIESILGWVLSAVAFIVDLIFALPIIGRLLRWIWDVALALFWFGMSLVDTVLGLIGVRPEKKLRLCVVMLNDRARQPPRGPGDDRPRPPGGGRHLPRGVQCPDHPEPGVHVLHAVPGRVTGERRVGRGHRPRPERQ